MCVREREVFGELPKLMKWVEEGNDVNRPTEHGTTLFHECVVHQQLHCASYLIQQGADVNLGNLHDGITPLHDAAREGDRDVVAFVLQKGAQVDSRSEKGTTPLMRAAVGGSVPAIRCLIAFGADVTLKDKAGATAERFAVKYGNNEARDVLKERARVLELVAWHRAAVREAAFWVQEAAAADAAVLLQRPYFVVRVDGVEGIDHNPPRRRSTRWRPRPSGRASKRAGPVRESITSRAAEHPHTPSTRSLAQVPPRAEGQGRGARGEKEAEGREGAAAQAGGRGTKAQAQGALLTLLCVTTRIRVLLALGNGQRRRARDAPHAALAQERVAVDPAVGLLEGLRAVAAECSGEHFHPPRMVVEVRRDVVDLAFIHRPGVLY